jgi:hypothetical protein
MSSKTKKTIPKALKIAVWNKYIGEDIGKTKCLCCNITDITQMKFHTGHIISEFNGGLLNIDNLKPICESCNKSMGTKNIDDFRELLISRKLIIELNEEQNIFSQEDIYQCKQWKMYLDFSEDVFMKNGPQLLKEKELFKNYLLDMQTKYLLPDLYKSILKTYLTN